MSDQVKTPKASSASDADLGRSQAVFIAIGLAIVMGGLWLLYQSDGPYHPEFPVTDAQGQVLEGS